MLTRHTTKFDDRGVSESIGFLLIFSIVIAGIGIVTLYGYPLLLQQQVSAEETIMEKNMIVLQNDFKSLAYKTVPYKETSLKIGGGSLTVYNSSSSPLSSMFKIYTDPINPYVASFGPGELRYESISSQTVISLQNGAVVMRPRVAPGSVMLAEPRWFYDLDPITNKNTMVINLINITSDNIMAKEGIGTVRMKLGDTNYTYVNFPAPTDIKLDITHDSSQNYSVAWDNYLTKTLPMTEILPSPNPPARTYNIPQVDNLVIKKYEVKIESI